jgi:hypothetical protein
METSMHGSLDKSGKDNSTSIYEKLGFGFLALPVLLLVTLLGLAIINPRASSWISQAVEAEFSDFSAPPTLAPTEMARPSMAIRTVKAN